MRSSQQRSQSPCSLDSSPLDRPVVAQWSRVHTDNPLQKKAREWLAPEREVRRCTGLRRWIFTTWLLLLGGVTQFANLQQTKLEHKRITVLRCSQATPMQLACVLPEITRSNGCASLTDVFDSFPGLVRAKFRFGANSLKSVSVPGNVFSLGWERSLHVCRHHGMASKRPRGAWNMGRPNTTGDTHEHDEAAEDAGAFFGSSR